MSTLSFVFVDEVMTYKNTTLLELLKDNTPSGWKNFFQQDEIQKILATISDTLVIHSREYEYQLLPPISDIFRAFYLTSFNNVKVVLLGQDPYHSTGENEFSSSATGLAFEVRQGNKINPSLKNIAAEVRNCGFKVTEGSGNLSSWASQGVLLLNTALTVVENCPNKHSAVWNSFSTELLKYITSKKKLVFLLLGRDAQSYEHILKGKQIIVKASHPSPLSANLSFLGSKCFNKVNEELIKMKLNPIDWSF
jgi:uracil-DNA glycosylase